MIGSEARADACIDAVINAGRFEVVRDYGKPFTTMVIADLLGVPDEDRDHFRKIFTGKPGYIRGDQRGYTGNHRRSGRGATKTGGACVT